MSVPFDAIDPTREVDADLEPCVLADCPACGTVIQYDPEAFESAREAHTCGNCLELDCECRCPMPGAEGDLE